MPLELATTIAELDNSWPLPGDPTNEGDDHIRLVKSVLQSQFPGEAGQGLNVPIVASEDDLNATQGSKANFQSQIDQLVTDLAALPGQVLQSIYPVGSLYTSSLSTNPGTLLGFGSWSPYGAGRVWVGVDGADPDFDDSQKTGGSKDAVVAQHNHTGTAASNGSHSHGPAAGSSFTAYAPGEATFILNSGGDWPVRPENTDVAGDHTHSVTVGNAGEDPAGKNLPPYITVYSWIRDA